MKKLQALRSGAGADIQASAEMKGSVVEEDCGSCSNCGGKGCAMCAKGKNEGDERELRTKMDLIKNKMRSAGIKVAGETPVARNRKMGGDVAEGMKQARANVGASKCWDGYKAKGTKKKDGKEVPNCVKEEGSDRLKDRRMERGGVGGNKRYDRPPAKKATNAELGIKPGKTAVQKELEKKHGKGKSAMDIVRAEIRAKHGKNALK